MSREIVETALTPSTSTGDRAVSRGPDDIEDGATLDDGLDGPLSGPTALHASAAALPQGAPAPTRRRLTALVAVAALVVVGAAIGSRVTSTSDRAARPTPTSAQTPAQTPAPTPTQTPTNVARSSPASPPAQDVDPGPSPTFVGAAVAALPVSPWLRADVASAGRDGADLGRVQISIGLTNTSADPLQVGNLTVLGLGTVLIPAGTVEALGTIDPAQTVRIPASVIADCTVRVDPAVSVIVAVRRVDPIADAPSRDNPPGRADEITVRATTAAPVRVQSVLDPICPPMRNLVAVAITGVRTDDDGSMTVRLVNHGYRSATIVALAGPDATPATVVLDPPLPLYLAPGEAVTARLRISVPGCAVPAPGPAADALSLEARIPVGFTQVEGWPTGSVEQALDHLATQCRARQS